MMELIYKLRESCYNLPHILGTCRTRVSAVTFCGNLPVTPKHFLAYQSVPMYSRRLREYRPGGIYFSNRVRVLFPFNSIKMRFN